MDLQSNLTPCGRTRREFLWQLGGGFTALPIVDLLSRDGFFDQPLHAAGPKKVEKVHQAGQHFPAKRSTQSSFS